MLKLSDIDFKAVVLGALVDNLGTMFAISLLILALSSTGLSEDGVAERLKTPSGELLVLIIGMGWTTTGGYAAGRMAKRSELLHGSMVAVIGILLALIFRDPGRPHWAEIAGFIAMLPVGIFGGYLARQRNNRTT